MTSQAGQKIMAIVILLKISRSKGNYNELQVIEYALKEYFYRKIMQKMRQAD